MEKYNDNFEIMKLDTRIQEVEEGYYCFEDTIFYGNKGGMEADSGTINGQKLLDLVYRDKKWWHKVEGELQDPIHMEVEEETRYSHTAIQSLLHLLDGYYRPLGITLVAVGVKEGNQWYEIDTKELEENHLQKVQEYLDRVIREDVPVEFSYIDAKEYPDEAYHNLGVLRIVKFGEYDQQACGTLHVNHTLQIGTAVVLGLEKTSRGTRVFVSCGNSTKNLLAQNYQQMKELSVLLACKKEEIIDKVENTLQNMKNINKENEELKEKLRFLEAKEIASSTENIVFLASKNAKELGAIANLLASQWNKNLFLLSEQGDTRILSIASSLGKARDIFSQLSQQLTLKGGGSPKVVTLTCPHTLEEIKAVLSKMSNLLL